MRSENTRNTFYALALAAVVCALMWGCGVDRGATDPTVPGPLFDAGGVEGASVASATVEEPTVTPIPTLEAPTPTLEGSGQTLQGGNDAPPPSGNRAEWPADVQAREKAVLFALAASPWPPELHAKAMAVMWCESSYSPDAESAGNRGLFQINAIHINGWIARAGYSWDDMLSAGPNLEVAWAIYQDQGWGPWSCQP